jgi:hypothetical protein
MQTRNYIPNDGYNVDAYIEPKPGLHESIRFTYRPIGPEKQAMLDAALNKLQNTSKNPAKFRKQAEFLTKRIVKWDYKDNKGEPVDISFNVVRNNLHPELFWRMFNIVYGISASDIDPRWSEKDQEDELDLILSAEEEGVSVSTARGERDEKNSVGG